MIFKVLSFWAASSYSILASLSDAPFRNQISFQDPATPVMSGIIFLYDYVWGYLIFVLIFVTWMLVRILFFFKEDAEKEIIPIVQNVPLEIIWTSIPGIILIVIMGNSFTHINYEEALLHTPLDIVIIGNQWFWTYEFMVFTKKISLESHMIETNDISLGYIRKLEVSNPLILPINTNIRLSITSKDVVYSLAVPSLGIKVDAVPGCVNKVNLYIQHEMTFRGQSAIRNNDGTALMPIVITSVSKEKYNIYLHYLNIKSRKGGE